MFVEESLWLRQALATLDLEPGMLALDVGSSTNDYRLETQPHIERNVLGLLRERGIEVRSLDAKPGRGIDYVCDLTASGADLGRSLGTRFELVLCNNVLVHLGDPERGAATIPSLVAPGGWLLASTPAAYRRVRDPLDNGLRPTPGELTELLTRGGDAGAQLEVVAQKQVRIDERSYYRRSPLKPSWFRTGPGWLPVPGVVEQLRYVLRPLRWAVSCVLLRRPELP